MGIGSILHFTDHSGFVSTDRSCFGQLYYYLKRVLMKPGLAYSNAVQAFAGYRTSVAGGGFDTLTVSIDQLYNQLTMEKLRHRPFTVS